MTTTTLAPQTKNYRQFNCYIQAMHEEITGSCILAVCVFPDGRKIKFVVDCGNYQEEKYMDYNYTFPFNPESVDFVLLTHNHADHTGRLGLLKKLGYPGKIYCTYDECNLLPLAIFDNYHVMSKEWKGKTPLFGENDLRAVLEKREALPFGKTIEIVDRVKVTAFPNAHLTGAAMYLVQMEFPEYESINVLFTGDWKRESTFVAEVPLPEWVKKLPLTIIQEATYGDRAGQPVKCFTNNVRNAILSGKTMVIPAFSLGRSQEVLFTLKQMQDSGELDVAVPIYLDGRLATNYTELFVNHKVTMREGTEDFLPHNCKFVVRQGGSELRRELCAHENKQTKIIVSSSGMGTHGPATRYITQYISRDDALIHFTGFCAPGSLGAELSNAKDGETVITAGVLRPKNAQIEYTEEFSGHARQDELLEFLEQFENLKLVLINHGTIEGKEIYARMVNEVISPKDVGILSQEWGARINPHGLVKTYATKYAAKL